MSDHPAPAPDGLGSPEGAERRIEEPRLGAVRRKLLEILQVPEAPHAPAGSGPVRVFRAADEFYYYQAVQWLLKQIGGAIGLFFGLYWVRQIPDFGYNWVIWGVEAVSIAFYLLQLPISFILVRLDFLLRWYIVTDRSLRIRQGILQVREQTIGFANIQNMSIQQGPLQQLLGIADLQVRTAGGGDKGSDGSNPGKKEQHNMHLGVFQGVSNAAEIRDLILTQRRGLKDRGDSGLGDPDAGRPRRARRPAAAPAVSADTVAAARELLAEARALRASS